MAALFALTELFAIISFAITVVHLVDWPPWGLSSWHAWGCSLLGVAAWPVVTFSYWLELLIALSK